MRALLAALAVVVGCGASTPPVVAPSAPSGRDLDVIKARGTLRVLTAGGALHGIPRTGSPYDRELARVETLARWLDVEIEYIEVRNRAELLDALLEGRGDLVAALMTRTPRREARVRFTHPIRYVREWVVVPSSASDPPKRHPDLAGRRIWVRPSSSFAERLVEQQARIGAAPQLVAIEEHLTALDTLERVGRGEFEVSIADSDAVQAYLAYRKDVQTAFALTDSAPIGWAIAPDAPKLLAAVNRFITDHVAVHSGYTFRGDLDEIKRRGLLRMAMVNLPVCFFFYRGMPTGYQFALAQRLAKRLGVRLEIVVARETRDMIALVLDGHADLTAGMVTITPERERAGAFSEPLSLVDEVLVQPANEPPITSVEQLAGRTVHVRGESPYWRTLTHLQAAVPSLKIVAAPEQLDTGTLIRMVGDGTIPLTMADYDILAVETSFRQDVRGTLAVGAGRKRGFVLRPDAPKLLAEVNALVTLERERMAREGSDPLSRQPPTRATVAIPKGALSPYDALARRIAAAHHLDWRLLVALMAQESGFDPKAKNLVGGVGLLPLLPHQAAELGLPDVDLTDPERSLEAGARRLAQLKTRIRAATDAEAEALLIATWHAGEGTLGDAVVLARKQNLPTNRWTGGVADALLLLGRMEYAGDARYGFCRGRHTVDYVSEVQKRLRAYRASAHGRLRPGSGG